MYKAESILMNGIHNIIYDFEIQTDHLILVRRPDLVLINKIKRTYHFVNFAVMASHKMKIKQSEKINKYLPKNWKNELIKSK